MGGVLLESTKIQGSMQSLPLEIERGMALFQEWVLKQNHNGKFYF
jgi:hypothetical protein